MGFIHPIKLKRIEVYAIRAAGGVSPSMALAEMPTRPALLLRIIDQHDCFGWGEVWANFPPRANIHKAHLIEDVVAERMRGLCITEPVEAVAYLREKLSTYFLHIGQQQIFEHILAGVDTALWDLALRSAGKNFVEHMALPQAVADCYASSINPSDIEQLLPKHAGYGQTHFKLKIGLDTDKDIAFIERAYALKPVGAQIMVDSNQSWQPGQAQHQLKMLERFNLFFAEEPMRADQSVKSWEDLARSTTIPLAGGENLYGIDSFLQMANAGLQYLQPDVAKWGGISGVLQLAQALPKGVKIWPHFMGTCVGQMAALSIAAVVGEGAMCEIDANRNCLRTALCGQVLRIDQGQVSLTKEPGLVYPPQSKYLNKYIE